MKTITQLFILLTLLFIISCSKSNDQIIREFINHCNSYDKVNSSKYISENFKYIGINDTLNYQEFIDRFDTLSMREDKCYINSIQDFDTIAIVDLNLADMFDSLLQVEPKLIQRRTMTIKAGKITSIQIDSSLNLNSYSQVFDVKKTAFLYFIENKHKQLDQVTFINNMKYYLSEFYNLSKVEKDDIFKYSSLIGTYVSNDNKYYKKLIFKGKTTVVVVDAIFGYSYPTSYVLDENFIRISTDQSDLLLEIVDNKTLVGEGFASGKFIKSNY